jgi:hypothetical protein
MNRNLELKQLLAQHVGEVAQALLGIKHKTLLDSALALVMSEILNGQLVYAVVNDAQHWFVRVTVPNFRFGLVEKTCDTCSQAAECSVCQKTGKFAVEDWHIDPEQRECQYDCDFADGGLLGEAGTLYPDTQILPPEQISFFDVREAVRHAEAARLLVKIPMLRRLKRTVTRKLKDRQRGIERTPVPKKSVPHRSPERDRWRRVRAGLSSRQFRRFRRQQKTA